MALAESGCGRRVGFDRIGVARVERPLSLASSLFVCVKLGVAEVLWLTAVDAAVQRVTCFDWFVADPCVVDQFAVLVEDFGDRLVASQNR